MFTLKKVNSPVDSGASSEVKGPQPATASMQLSKIATVSFFICTIILGIAPMDTNCI